MPDDAAPSWCVDIEIGLLFNHEDLLPNALRVFAVAHEWRRMSRGTRIGDCPLSGAGTLPNWKRGWAQPVGEHVGGRNGWADGAGSAAAGGTVRLQDVAAAVAPCVKRARRSVTISAAPSFAARWRCLCPAMERAYPRIQPSVLVNQRIEISPMPASISR
jgi:hypothetical protein